MVRYNQRGIANDTADQMFPNIIQRTRFKEVVREIVATETLARDLGIKTEEAEIKLSLPHDVYAKLKVLAHDKKENGRTVGVGRYIEAILLQHLRSKGLL